MACCLKCGRELDKTLEMFCPHCLEKEERLEKGKRPFLPLTPRFVYCSLGVIAVCLFAVMLWYYINPFSPKITIPDHYPTIQEGISAASAGITVIVKPGIYHENIDFMGKAITLRSTNARDPDVVARTVIQGSGKTPTVRFQGGEEADSVLQGFTIRGGLTAQGSQRESIPELAAGGVIYISGGSAPLIRDNVIVSGTARRGGAIYINNSSPTIVHNTIAENRAQWEGGAFYISEGARPEIRENNITNNTAEDGGGIYVLGGAPLLQNNRIAENSAAYRGGGIMVQGGGGEFGSNVFEANRAGECGGAAAFFESSLLLQGNHFAANSGGWRGGGAIYGGFKSALQLVENSFELNEGEPGGDIWISADSSLQDGRNGENTQPPEGLDIFYQD